MRTHTEVAACSRSRWTRVESSGDWGRSARRARGARAPWRGGGTPCPRCSGPRWVVAAGPSSCSPYWLWGDACVVPVLALARRADVASVIGSAMAAKATGSGHRRIAAELGRPAETVRGWLRRFTGRVEAVRVVFTGWCRALAADPGCCRGRRALAGCSAGAHVVKGCAEATPSVHSSPRSLSMAEPVASTR